MTFKAENVGLLRQGVQGRTVKAGGAGLSGKCRTVKAGSAGLSRQGVQDCQGRECMQDCEGSECRIVKARCTGLSPVPAVTVLAAVRVVRNDSRCGNLQQLGAWPAL